MKTERHEVSPLASQSIEEAALAAQIQGNPAAAMKLVLMMSEKQQEALAAACKSLIAFVPMKL
ncbi:hypothetical protein PZT66_24860 [Pseudomonas aeruginosa]|uniref:Uncharacterized protein n=1 Tax=Pseudomonas aeruginosa TaxID=287 RepID=A0A6C0L3D2_PSEAI|nr:hypothetical protein [Pseudomonas aeruginosa]EKU6312355.1 hypothetical protein [Pseudomonas aeruginosa]EKV3036722.1 hypothetical protein [Pseudomonas aeruginosa]EKV3075608.1 hypothetical protein [Pseudomonas aeruginosa]EKX2973806.1 hypothetical protein [Pseudomonas aeruginosa]ELD5773021.1 hypothetical protein [Pseudomonas aeruginosa]